jgi:RHS repeat-associated protein
MQGAGGVGGLLANRWVNSGNTDYFPTYDGNGNVVQYLTTAGAVTTHYEYDPFGTLTRLTGNNSIRFQYRFSTKPRDFYTGLYYYGYRWYDTVTGRWPSRDPIGERGGINLYGLVENSGITNWDVLGLSINQETGPEKANRLLKNGKDCGCYKISAKFNKYDIRHRNANSGVDADFDITANPTNASGCACDCTKIKVIQFVQTTGMVLLDYRRRRTTENGKGWRVDAGDEFGGKPFVSDTGSGRTGDGGLVGGVSDPAGTYNLIVTYNSGTFDAHTCLMCVDGGKDKAKIIGCVSWGYNAIKVRRPKPGENSYKTGSMNITLRDPKHTCGSEISNITSSAIAQWDKASEENKVFPGLQ